MPEKVLKGISFPFRIGKTGGVVMSISDSRENTHIEEGIEQVLTTFRSERAMESQIYSDLDTRVFSSNNESARTLLAYQIREALQNHMPYIEVADVDIESKDNYIFALITYVVIRTGVQDTSRIRIGDMNEKPNAGN